MTRLSRVIISRIVRKAKELSDEEVLSLYHQVKEKLDGQQKSENQVLDGAHAGPAPQNEETTSLIPPSEDGGESTDKEIDELLNSLGLGDGQTAEKTAAEPGVPETKPPVSPVAPTSTPAEPVTPPAKEIRSEPPVVNQPVQAPASKPIGVNQVEVEAVPPPQLPPEEPSTTEIPPVTPSLPDDETEDNPTGELVGNEGEEIIDRVTEKIVSDPQFGIENFKTAARGLQVNRKDKDLMADGITKPKYETPDIKPPRTDARDPNGVRYKKNEENRDKDTDGDKDLKLSSNQNIEKVKGLRITKKTVSRYGRETYEKTDTGSLVSYISSSPKITVDVNGKTVTTYDPVSGTTIFWN